MYEGWPVPVPGQAGDHMRVRELYLVCPGYSDHAEASVSSPVYLAEPGQDRSLPAKTATKFGKGVLM